MILILRRYVRFHQCLVGLSQPYTTYPQVKVRLPFPTADPAKLTRAAHTQLCQITDGTRYARRASC